MPTFSEALFIYRHGVETTTNTYGTSGGGDEKIPARPQMQGGPTHRVPRAQSSGAM